MPEKINKNKCSILNTNKQIKRKEIHKRNPISFMDLPNFFYKCVLHKETQERYFITKITLYFPQAYLDYKKEYDKPEILFTLQSEKTGEYETIPSEVIVLEYTFVDESTCEMEGSEI